MSLLNLGENCIATRNYKQAEEMFEKYFQLQDFLKIEEMEFPQILALARYGDILFLQGKYQQSLPKYKNSSYFA